MIIAARTKGGSKRLFKKLSTKDKILSVLFVAWIAILDIHNLTFIQIAGIIAIVFYFIALYNKVKD